MAEMLRKIAYVVEDNADFFMVKTLRTQALAVIGEWSQRAAEKRVLDVGCGAQPFRAEFERHGFRYVGSDVGPINGMAPDWVFSLGEAVGTSSPPGGQFPFVFCSEVLEHVPDWNSAFENLSQLTAKGGEIFLTTPFVFPRHEEPSDFFRGSPSAFSHFAARHGLEIVYSRQAGGLDSALGTVLGYALQTFRYQPRGSLEQRALRFLLFLLRRLIQRGRYEKYLDHGHSFYLSNVVLMRKL